MVVSVLDRLVLGDFLSWHLGLHCGRYIVADDVKGGYFFANIPQDVLETVSALLVTAWTSTNLTRKERSLLGTRAATSAVIHVYANST